MKIIKEGKRPEEIVYRATCGHCKTVFEFEAKEARYINDQRDGNLLKISCPLCRHDVYSNVKV